MSFACFCVHLAILDQGRGHVVTIWIIFYWFWLLRYQFIRFLGSTWPVLQPSIQSISKRSAAKLSLRPAWKAQIGTVTGILRTMTRKKTWEKQLRKTEKIEKSKCCIFWCVEICCETSWWKECMGGCSTDTEISLAETCGIALVSATLSVSNQAMEGNPWCLDLRTKNLWFDANFWCEGHFWCDWIGAWLPLQAWISQISWISPIITVWILWIRFDSFFSCEALHQPWWWKPHRRHWPLHLCPVAKIRSNTEAMYVFSVNSFMCSRFDGVYISICKIDINQYLCRFWTKMDMISFFIVSKVTGVVDIAPRSTVGPGLSLLSLGCSGGCSEASKEIMSDKEAM